MSTPPASADGTTAGRRPRADAVRNRARIVEAARAAFATDGDAASLEGIAKTAGVGIGSLYRAFPTRDDLVAAAYASELDAVLAAADELLAAQRDRPDLALRAFTGRYADFIETKRGLAESLRSGSLRSAAEAVDTRARVNEVVGRFLAAGVEAGLLRADWSADDVTAAMVGVFLTAGDRPDRQQTDRLLDLLVRGLRR